MRITVAVVLAFFVCAFIGCGRTSTAPTVIYVVRHAEKASESEDPPLTLAGVSRAEALARTLEHAGVTAIYSSPFQRTRDTAKPLAERLGIPVTEPAANFDDPITYAKQLAGEVAMSNRGQTVLIVNHSNTVPVIVEALSGRPVAPIANSEYATLFIVIIPSEGPASVTRAQYGQPDNVAAAPAPPPVPAPTPAPAAKAAGR